ncbi:hypothetical protein QM012_004023 [Aureobasidium pullulans]|uniref:EamA domain-containing protein n=1 Tax=Aureobasidium pullulans TaxID=5580 RepID=A0ABR0T7R4_AURPU
MSTVSCKHILLTSNYHYPYTLLLLQLGAASILILLRDLCYAERVWDVFGSKPDLGLSFTTNSIQQTLRLALLSYCLAFFSPLWIQSTLHFENIVTLLMILPIISLFDLGTHSLRYRTSICMTVILSCLLILFDDYKTTPNGLLFGIPAVLILGVVFIISRNDPADDAGSQLPHKDQTSSLSVMILPFLTATACLFFLEGEHEVALTRKQMPLLCLNLITTAVTIALWPSMLRQTKDNISHSVNFLALPGFAALFSQQLALPVYLSWVQVLAFLVSICCCAFTVFKKPDPSRTDEQDWLELSSESEDDAKYPDTSFNDDTDFRGRVRKTWSIHHLVFLAITTAHTSRGLRLDTGYNAASNIDIVMSMDHEPPSHITDTFSLLKSIPPIGSKSPRLILYTKDPLANTAELQHLTNATKVIQLPNIGREGHTYLHHILSSWDDLATQTFFLQASIHNPREFSARVKNYYTSETGMLSLGFSGQSCECNNCGDRFGWQDHSGIVEKTWKEVFNQTCGEQRVLLSYKGQFVASAARLRANDKALYEGLMKALEEPESWAHQPDYLQGRPDSLNAPYFGYTLERLWSVILQCSEERIAALCPTLLSGTRRGGSKEDCQCFDSS